MLTNKYMEIERPEHLGGYNIIPYKERLVYILASRIFAKDPECQPAGDICWDYIQNENIQGHPRLHREQVHQFLNDLGTHLEVIFSAEQPSERTLLIYQLLNSNGKDSIIMSVFLTEPAKLEVFDKPIDNFAQFQKITPENTSVYSLEKLSEGEWLARPKIEKALKDQIFIGVYPT